MLRRAPPGRDRAGFASTAGWFCRRPACQRPTGLQTGRLPDIQKTFAPEMPAQRRTIEVREWIGTLARALLTELLGILAQLGMQAREYAVIAMEPLDYVFDHFAGDRQSGRQPARVNSPCSGLGMACAKISSTPLRRLRHAGSDFRRALLGKLGEPAEVSGIFAGIGRWDRELQVFVGKPFCPIQLVVILAPPDRRLHAIVQRFLSAPLSLRKRWTKRHESGSRRDNGSLEDPPFVADRDPATAG